ncbi:hypothetical protein KQ51_01490 [Candidatus Izimaplasma bacterium HR1]|uniref:hypothetical protein n=1 Tax=Candidatus Izimoplasma sp. HR1 TaxID=1541959 RepID=UPI0004F6C64F|nr:hypothetical protein KQ51_01490 [Candidatus Izimaplasma bacterium HR1]
MIFISVVLPILLLILASWFISINYRNYITNWGKELTTKKIIKYGIQVFIKSSLMFGFIIIIHNYYHTEHHIELLLFVGIYFVVSIIQSAYSIGGFLSRFKFIMNYSLLKFRKKSQEAEDFKNRITDSAFDKYTFAIKLIIIASFLIIFIPNISVFILANIFYFLLIISLIILSLLLNNLIYFGFVSLMIFQYAPVDVSFTGINYLVILLSFLVLMIGVILETRLDSRMVKIVASRMIKDVNVSVGFTPVYQKKGIIVYQNNHNLYYYVYYRYNGIVVVFESFFDAKLSNFIVRKMVNKGSQYLQYNGEL